MNHTTRGREGASTSVPTPRHCARHEQLEMEKFENEIKDEKEMSGMVVAVRIKPMDANENEFSIQSLGKNLIKIESYEPKTYQFDYVHWSTGTSVDYPNYVSQEMVFETIGYPIVQNSSLGYNCSLFAYGQTGSGKTYTMLGEPRDEGLIPRVCHALMAAPVMEGTVRTFKITYVEIFLEKVRDLLKGTQGSVSSKSLKVREHPTDGPFVEGAISAEILNFTECMKLMELGSKNRVVATTKMNEQSSRSHAIFTITSTVTKKLDDTATAANTANTSAITPASARASVDGEDVYTVVSKINLIDLAGSENAITAGSTGERLKEGAAINKSLLTLGRVIKVLAENSSLRNHQKHVRRSTVGTVSGQRGGGGELGSSLGASADCSTPTHPSTASTTASVSTVTPAAGSSRSHLNNLRGSERRGSGGFSSPVLKRGASHGAGMVGAGGEKSEAPSGIKKPTMIPYRDSVLTYLLKDSLGGNSKTTMIATIRPGMQYAEETATTLRYAAQAKKIVNVVVINENPYVKMIKKLQHEVEELTNKLKTMKPESPKKIRLVLSSEDSLNEDSSTPTAADADANAADGALSTSPLTAPAPTATAAGIAEDQGQGHGEGNGEFGPVDSLESSLDEETKQKNISLEPLLEIPKLTRQFTSPNDQTPQTVPSGETETEVGTVEMERISEDSLDPFTLSPVISPSSEDEEEEGDEEEDDFTEEQQHQQHAPMSPAIVSKSRQISEEKMPHLLNSLQKKLLMVRQTSLEVSETFDRLSSPTKKSQNRPQRPFSFQLASDRENSNGGNGDGDGRSSPEVNGQATQEEESQGQEQEQEQERQQEVIEDVVVTPYRPVALFRDLLAEEEEGEKGLPQQEQGEREGEDGTSEDQRQEVQGEGQGQGQGNDNSEETYSVSTTEPRPIQNEMSPVVILYSGSSYQSTLPTPSSDLPTTVTAVAPVESDDIQRTHNSSLPAPAVPVPVPPESGSMTRISHTSHGSYESDMSLSQQVCKEGFLMKRGYINKAFQRRWCVLRGTGICYYKQYRDKEMRGRINCQQATVVRAENYQNNLPFAFYIHTPLDREHKKWLLQAASEDEMNSWISAIEHVVLTHLAATSPGDNGERRIPIEQQHEQEESNCIIS